MSVTPQEQCTFLGNGIGQVYLTNSSGTLGNDPYAPSRGIENGILAKNRAIAVGMGARKRAVNTRAVAYVTITNAAADNLTVFTIGGVSQITAPVAMTAGNPTASVVSIVAAINSTVTSPDWTAVANGATFSIQCQTAGGAGNDLAIVLTFSGASTASYPALTGGGNDSSEYATRIFLDTDPLASPTAINMGSAVEITSALASLPPNPPTDVAVVASALTFTRKDTTNNVAATGGGTIPSIFMADAQEGDIVTVSAKAGEPSLTLYNPTGTGNLSLGISTPFVSGNPIQSITLQWRLVTAPSTYKWVEVSPRIAPYPEDLRSYGSQVPLVAGSLAIATILGGGVTPFTPGGTDNYNAYLTGPGVLAGGGFSVPLVAGADIEDGDNGTIYGNGVALTGDPLTVAGFIVPTALKATGLWSIDWRYVSGGFIIMPSWDLVNTPDWITTAMIAPAAVTNTELATGIDGAKISADTIPVTALTPATQSLFGGLAAIYETVDVVFTAVRSLATTPVDVPSAVTVAGVAYVAMNFMAEIRTYAGVAYNAGDVFWLKTFGASDPQFIDSTTPQATVKTARPCNRDVTVAAGGTQVIGNAKLQITSAADLTLGTSDVRFHVWYVAVPMT